MVLKNRTFPFWGWKANADGDAIAYRFTKKDGLDYYFDWSCKLYNFSARDSNYSGDGFFRTRTYPNKFAISTVSKMKSVKHLTSKAQKTLIALMFKRLSE